MQLLSSVDTTTFVLVVLLLFFIYNLAVFCWFKFHPGKKDGDDEVSKFTGDVVEDLPF